MTRPSDSLELPRRAIVSILSNTSDVIVDSKRRADTLVTRVAQHCGVHLPFPLQHVAMASVSCIAITTALASKIGELGDLKQSVREPRDQDDISHRKDSDSTFTDIKPDRTPESQHRAVQDSPEELTNKYNNKERECIELRRQLQDSEILVSSMNQRLESVESKWRTKHDSLVVELSELHERIIFVTDQHKERSETLETELSHHRSTNDQQTNVLEDLSARIAARDDEIAKLRTQLTSVQESFRGSKLELENKLQDKATHADDLANRLNLLQDTLSKQNGEHEALCRELKATHESTIAEHIQSIDQLRLDHSEAMNSAQSLHDAEIADLAESHQAELEYMRNTIDTARQEKAEASNLVMTKTREISSLQTDHANETSNLRDGHQKEISDLQRMLQQTETNYKAHISKIEDEIVDHQKTNEAQQMEIQNLQQENVTRLKASETLHTEKLSLEKSSSWKITQLTNELHALQKSTGDITARNAELESSLHNLLQVKDRNMELKDLLSAEQEHSTKRNRELSNLKADLEQVTTHLDRAQGDHQELQTRLSHITSNHAREKEILEEAHNKAVLERDEAVAETVQVQKAADEQAARGLRRSQSEVSLLKIVNRDEHGDLLTTRNAQGELKASIVTNKYPLFPIAGLNRQIPSPFTEGASKFSEHLGNSDDESMHDADEQIRAREHTERVLVGASNSTRQAYIPSTTVLSDDGVRRTSGGSAKVVSPKTPSTTAFDRSPTSGIMVSSSPRQAPIISSTNGHGPVATTPTRRQSGFKRLFRRASAKFNKNDSASASPQSMTEMMNNGVLHK